LDTLSPRAHSAAPPALTPPPGNRRFPLLDGARAIAALSVLLFHSVQYGELDSAIGTRIGSHLNGGVAIFFLISGFLLYRPFVVAREGLAPAIPAGKYLGRRLLRIVPAFWVALLLLEVWPGLPGVFDGDGWYEFGFLKIYSESAAGQGLVVSWSLCTELSFYLLLPVYAWLLSRVWRGRPRRQRQLDITLLVTLAVASIGAHTLLAHTSHPTLTYSLPGTFYLFAAGMALAVLSVANDRGHALAGVITCAQRRPWLFILAAIVVLLTISFGTARETSGAVSPEYGVVGLLLLFPLVFADRPGTRFARTFGNGVLPWLGLVSYGLYLWHVPVIEQVSQLVASDGSTLRFLAQIVVSIIIATALAAASYYVVERPFLKLKPGIRRRR
jgi:peptidoglycan/LPS O-acetylase OafA/YrhL